MIGRSARSCNEIENGSLLGGKSRKMKSKSSSISCIMMVHASSLTGVNGLRLADASETRKTLRIAVSVMKSATCPSGWSSGVQFGPCRNSSACRRLLIVGTSQFASTQQIRLPCRASERATSAQRVLRPTPPLEPPNETTVGRLFSSISESRFTRSETLGKVSGPKYVRHTGNRRKRKTITPSALCPSLFIKIPNQAKK